MPIFRTPATIEIHETPGFGHHQQKENFVLHKIVYQ